MMTRLFQIAVALLTTACSNVPGDVQSSRVEIQPRPVEATSLRDSALPIRGNTGEYDPLLEAIGDARIVALGEATHGTHEFYVERARITERLVREKGFSALVIEADWPDTDRVNRYVRGLSSDSSAEEALAAFRDFPKWMWRNAEFRDFVERLRACNADLPVERRVGVYGMDVYDFFDAVLAYLERRDAAAATRARTHYGCIFRYRSDPHRYGEATRRPSRSCATQVKAVREELQKLNAPPEPAAREAHSSALHSAASVIGAEEYYRVSATGSNSWNVRDRHMFAVIQQVSDHTRTASGEAGEVIVWAHNSHVGDARSTDAKMRGELNIGQLMREAYGSDAFLTGFLTYERTVIAAHEWDTPGERRKLRPALPGSYEHWFRSAGLQNALVLLRDRGTFSQSRIERAVGVIYAPQTSA